MAKRKQHMGERYIEADNGSGWTRKSYRSALSVASGSYVMEIFGITYRLEKFRDNNGTHGWYLYSIDLAHFLGEYCAKDLMSAVDVASEMIAKADLRGEGYERKR